MVVLVWPPSACGPTHVEGFFNWFISDAAFTIIALQCHYFAGLVPLNLLFHMTNIWSLSKTVIALGCGSKWDLKVKRLQSRGMSDWCCFDLWFYCHRICWFFACLVISNIQFQSKKPLGSGKWMMNWLILIIERYQYYLYMRSNRYINVIYTSDL